MRETPTQQLSFPFLQVALFTCILPTTRPVGRLANLLNKQLFKPYVSKAVYGEGHKDVHDLVPGRHRSYINDHSNGGMGAVLVRPEEVLACQM